MAETPIHRMAEEELPRVLEMLAATGATARTDTTWRQDAMTALLLGDTAAPAAAMPISRRSLRIGPGPAGGRTLPAGWITSNMFPQKMGWRRHSRATAGRWAELLPDCDILTVVRRDQPNAAARWYAQTGFHTVMSIRCLYLAMEQPPGGQAGRYLMKVIGPAEVDQWSGQMLEVHNAVFANTGGTVARHARYWGPALEHHFYGQHYQFQVIGLWSADTLMGYAVVGWSGWHSPRPRMDILELATRQWDTGIAEELIRTTCQLAWSKNVMEVRAVISVHDPYRGYLARTGFVDQWGYVMLAKWLWPQRYLDALQLGEALGASDLTVQIQAAGEVPLRIATGRRTMRLTGDASAITRLLLQRLEISTAVHDGTLVVTSGGDIDRDVAALSMAFPWTPWAFHMLDYI